MLVLGHIILSQAGHLWGIYVPCRGGEGNEGQELAANRGDKVLPRLVGIPRVDLLLRLSLSYLSPCSHKILGLGHLSSIGQVKTQIKGWLSVATLGKETKRSSGPPSNQAHLAVLAQG